MDVLGDEFGGFVGLYGRNGREEINKLDSGVAVCKEEIKAVFNFTNVDTFSVRIVLEDELFEVEESTLVGDLLPYLDAGAPGIGGIGFGAVRALGVDDYELDFESLDEVGVLEGL